VVAGSEIWRAGAIVERTETHCQDKWWRCGGERAAAPLTAEG
jgi:hypothetical protein